MELRVFLVEDLANMQVLMGELFSTMGGLRLVGTASTEAEARLWLEQHEGEWDLTIVDLVLHQGSGFSVIEVASRQPSRGEIVAFSGYASSGVRQRCLQLGASAAFDKAQTEDFLAWLAAFAATARRARGPAP